MKNFAEFITANRTAIYAHAEANTPRNEKGDAVITRADPWFNDDTWDDYFKELNARDDSASGSMVR